MGIHGDRSRTGESDRNPGRGSGFAKENVGARSEVYLEPAGHPEVAPMKAASLKSPSAPVLAVSIGCLLALSVATGLSGRSEARASSIPQATSPWSLPVAGAASEELSDPDATDLGGMGMGGGGGGPPPPMGGGGPGGMSGGGGAMSGGMSGGSSSGGSSSGGSSSGGSSSGGSSSGGSSSGGSSSSGGGSSAPPPSAPTPAPAPPPPPPPPTTTPTPKPTDLTDTGQSSSKGSQTSSKASKARIAWLAAETTDRFDGALQYMVASIVDKFLDRAFLTLRRSVCVPGPGEGPTAGTPAAKLPPEAAASNVADLTLLAVKTEKDDKLTEARTAVDLLVQMRGSGGDLTFQGWVHERQGDPDGALEAYEKVLKMDPKSVGARIGRVFGKIALGKGLEALAHLDDDKDAPKDDLLFGLARVFAVRAAEQQKDRDAAAAAAKAGKKGAKAAKPDASGGEGKDKDGKDAKAVDPAEAELLRVGEAAIAANRGYREVLDAALRLGAYDVARKVLEMSAAKAPNDEKIATLRTILEIYTNQDARAREILDQGRAAAPKDLNLLFLEGVLEVRAKRLDKALALWRQGNEQDPMNGLLALAVAHGLDRKGSKDAMAAYRHAIEVDRKLGEPHAAIALLLNKKGDFEGAEAELIAASKLEPSRPEFYYYLAIIQGDRLGFMGRALDALRLYRGVGGNDPAALAWLEALENA